MPENVSLVVARKTAISDSRRNDSRYRLAIFGDRILETVSCPSPISVAAWFDTRGSGLVLSQEGGRGLVGDAHTQSKSRISHRSLRQGDTPIAAAQQARERYEPSSSRMRERLLA
jgi:hypothetical protein